MELLLNLCRYGTAFLFLIAAISKILNFKGFLKNLSELFSAPKALSTFFALFIVFLELVLAIALLTLSGSAKLEMLLALFVMVVFSVVLVTIYWLKGPLRCNCFGEQHRTFSFADMLRNLLIISGISFYLIIPEVDVQYNSTMLMSQLALSLLLVLVVIHLHETIELFFLGSSDE